MFVKGHPLSQKLPPAVVFLGISSSNPCLQDLERYCSWVREQSWDTTLMSWERELIAVFHYPRVWWWWHKDGKIYRSTSLFKRHVHWKDEWLGAVREIPIGYTQKVSPKLNEWLEHWASWRGYGISILGDFQNFPGQGPGQPDLSLKLTLLQAGGWTCWPPENTSIQNYLRICLSIQWTVLNHNVKDVFLMWLWAICKAWL